ncbi:MAG: hypothetical protein KGJ25_12340, partial [Betaproteobacteria bacterium]|nr:hypothetical protein [Betaproteobacteria bacterium]
AGLAVMTAVYFALAWIFRSPRPPEARIGLRRTLRLVWREFRTLAGAAPRMMLYRRLVPDRIAAGNGIPVVLVHGVLCNAGVFTRLSRFLAECDVDGVASLSYGPPLASIEVFADQLAHKLDAVLAVTGAPQAMIVSHSMGGVVTRAYIRRYGSAKLARVLTIGAPHHGSVHAWLFPGTSLAQLRPGNRWLAALASDPLDPTLGFVSLWSWHDSMIAPQLSSRLDGAIDLPVVGVGHNALLADPQVFARTLAEIEAARAVPAPRAVRAPTSRGPQAAAGATSESPG